MPFLEVGASIQGLASTEDREQMKEEVYFQKIEDDSIIRWGFRGPVCTTKHQVPPFPPSEKIPSFVTLKFRFELDNMDIYYKVMRQPCYPSNRRGECSGHEKNRYHHAYQSNTAAISLYF